MASLYTSTNNARKILLIIGAIALLIIGFDTFIKFRETTLRPVTETRRFYLNPDLALGSVPVPEIPKLNIDINGIPITQESVHGVFPDVSYVYKVEQPREKSNTFENATKTAAALGFTAQGLRDLGNNNFRWAISDGSKTLDYNKISQVFKLDTVYENNTDAKKTKTISSNIQTYVNRGPGIIGVLGFRDALGFTTPIVDARYLVRTERGDAIETQKASEANYVAMNIFRKIAQADLKEAKDQPDLLANEIKPQPTTGKVYTDDPRYGELSLVVSNSAGNLATDVFEMDFINYEYSTTGVYFIITPDEAVSLLQRGSGTLVALTAEGDNYFSPYTTTKVKTFKIDARRTELAFYEPKKWSGLVYPIYVLSGTAELENGKLARFIFYIDAIKRQGL